MSNFGSCKRCEWEYIQEMSFVRPQPWSDDDSGLMFQTCARCGNLSIQHFSPDGNVGSVWMLSANAMVLFRAGAPPNKVFDYAFSEDFFRNRGITQRLLRGYLRHMRDLSGVANTLISRIDEVSTVGGVEICVEALRDLLVEYLRRHREGTANRLSVATIEPVAKLMLGRRPLQETTNAVELRLQTLEILEMFAQPVLWDSLPSEEAALLEETIDHGSMVEESIAAINGFTFAEPDDEIVRRMTAELKFFFRVFRRRTARLSRDHAAAVWELMRRLEETREVDNPLDIASRAYESGRQLLEHQLVESGFLKLGPKEVAGVERVAFQSPNTPEVLHLPHYEAWVEIFETSRATEPATRIDSWTSALDRL